MKRVSLLVGTGTALAVLGIVLLCDMDTICSYIFRKELSVSPTSYLYKFWQETPSPFLVDVYLFNCTNPDQLMQRDFKPQLVQLGPYRFIERVEKVNISWNGNHTVTYKLMRHFSYDSENSNGSLQDKFTSLDVAALAVSHVTRHWGYISALPLSAAIRLLAKSVWMTTSVGDYLINGYSDPLLTLAKMTKFSQSGTSKDKLGVIYERNGTTDFDGVMNIDTGEEDFSKTGTIRYHNYENRTRNFGAQCGRVIGSPGELFGPIPTRERRMYIFNPEICRSVPLQYLQDVEVNGVTGYRYGISKELNDNGTVDPDSQCNCGGDCLPQGVINTTTCLRNAPVYMSLPHFLGADPHYRRQVAGMRPDPHIHEFYITVEPTTGITLEAKYLLQVNMLLRANANIGLYRGVPTVMVPMMWFETRFTLPPRFTFLISVFLKLPVIGLYLSIGLLSLGVLLLLSAFLQKVLFHTGLRRTNRMVANSPTVHQIPSCPEGKSLLRPEVAQSDAPTNVK